MEIYYPCSNDFFFIGNFLPFPLTVLKSADPRGRARISKLPYNVFPFAFKKWGKAERIEGISHTDAIHRFVEKIIYNTNNFNDCLLLIQLFIYLFMKCL